MKPNSKTLVLEELPGYTEVPSDWYTAEVVQEPLACWLCWDSYDCVCGEPRDPFPAVAIFTVPTDDTCWDCEQLFPINKNFVEGITAEGRYFLPCPCWRQTEAEKAKEAAVIAKEKIAKDIRVADDYRRLLIRQSGVPQLLRDTLVIAGRLACRLD